MVVDEPLVTPNDSFQPGSNNNPENFQRQLFAKKKEQLRQKAGADEKSAEEVCKKAT